nr:Protein MRPS-31 [Haemonchus contortus]
MLKKFVPSLRIVRQSFRLLSSESGGDDKKGPSCSTKDVIGDELLDAVNAVVDDLHKDDPEAKKTTKNTLISKLITHEKATYDEATGAQMQEMLDDKAIQGLLSAVATDAKASSAVPNRFVQERQERRGLLLLRKEIFYQAVQSGIKSAEAQKLAENAVAEAQERIAAQRKARLEGIEASKEAEKQQKVKRAEEEQRFYDYAYQMAEKMLYHDDVLGDGTKARKTIKPDPAVPSLLKGSKRLGIWKNLEGCQDHSLGFWSEWDLRAARIINQSLGPENSFEEQIQWTEQGKQWPYPIDNEYMLGPEAEVPFYDHIFLERHLAGLGLPKDGPIAHFMELVCVGMSKNPYMTREKKMENLNAFAEFFNEEKQKLIKKLHEEEQLAAQQA